MYIYKYIYIRTYISIYRHKTCVHVCIYIYMRDVRCPIVFNNPVQFSRPHTELTINCFFSTRYL